MLYATDIANFLACQHHTTLDHLDAEGKLRPPVYFDPTADLLRQLGMEHEQAYLRHLKDERGLKVVEISVDLSWGKAVAATLAALKSGAEAVYQATLQNGDWGGRADFLLRVDRPSWLGFWSYEAVETKLARTAKAGALIQLCFYSDLLTGLQGVEPEWMHIVLGGGARLDRRAVRRYIAYFRKVRHEFERTWESRPETYPEPVEHCEVCRWQPLCDKQRRNDDYVSLVAGITGNQRKALAEREVTTLAGLARINPPVTPKIDAIGEAAFSRIWDQARIQLRGRDEQRWVYELLEPAGENLGLSALPLPSPGDIFLDFESDPYAFDEGIEYLIGMTTAPAEPNRQPGYEAIWALDRRQERNAFAAMIEKIMTRLQRYPSMHVYHYAAYEQTAIKRLSGRHGICADEVDHLLRAGVFVDLYRVVRQSLRASVESYSIKKLEPLYGYVRDVPLQEANLALSSFGAVLGLRNSGAQIDTIRNTVQGYNRDDCVSTLRLRDWLEGLRSEVAARQGAELPRPVPKPGDPKENLAAQLERVQKVADLLTRSLPADESVWSPEQQACWLLAQLLEWHRREDKSAWWEYFRLCDLSDEELLEDKTALGGLTYFGPVGETKRSTIHRYTFPPQPHSIDRAHSVRDPRTHGNPGQVVSIDDLNLTIDLKRRSISTVEHPTALIPYEIIPSQELQDSLLRLGAWVGDNGIDAEGPFRAARDLLLRLAPRLRGASLPLLSDVIPENASEERNAALDRARHVGAVLNDSVLPIQGPPGSGKTYTASHMIIELVRLGRRVGITAVSHKVITNLLDGVCEQAAAAKVEMRIIQKVENDGCEDEAVTQVTENGDVLDALHTSGAQVAAGTAWLWSREEMAESIDVLFVDEAGQMSLANVLAVAPAAASVVLLGDPQQLDQPQRGVHPPGAEVSALAHLLHGKPTIGEGQGLFLAETWRLPPDVCGFTSQVFYENRLRCRPENQRQRLNAATALGGTGLRFAPVAHTGNQSESSEEVARVLALVNALLEGSSTWTDKTGQVLPLREKDILVVAPYNAQVAALKEALPETLSVGTVDKFQGRQAPVVLYSMATSSPQDAPRGMEFLYSLNRLNVAVSRAQCVAVIVASPELFRVRCKTPRQMELANAFCRYFELATVV